MKINLGPNEELKLDGKVYTVQPDPDWPNRPYIELGGSAQVVQLLMNDTESYHALKIFDNPETSSIEEKTKNLKKNKVSRLPGLLAAQRIVINPDVNLFSDLVQKYPFLANSILMPWIAGHTWCEILGDNKEDEPKIPRFPRAASLFYASQLAIVLASLEAQGYAHCDICSNNIILDIKNPSIQLIDLEDMYLPGAARTNGFIGGQNGYAHPIRPSGHQWVKESDRFGGGLLISELIAWCDPKIRQASESDCYANNSELCKNSSKFNLMKNVLGQQGSGELSNLFDRLWKSKSLEDCPTILEWEQQVNIVAKAEGASKPVFDGLSPIGADGRLRIKRIPIVLTEQVVTQNPPIHPARKQVNISVPQTPAPPGRLPIFHPTKNWGTVARSALFVIAGIAILIAIISAIHNVVIRGPATPAAQVIATQIQIATSSPVVDDPTATYPPTSIPTVPTTQIPPEIKGCPSAPPFRVKIGDTARVLDNRGYPLYLRSDPEIGQNVQWYLTGGDLLSIIDGPVCSGGFSFFKVVEISTGNTGWVAEADSDSTNYFIEPVP